MIDGRFDPGRCDRWKVRSGWYGGYREGIGGGSNIADSKRLLCVGAALCRFLCWARKDEPEVEVRTGGKGASTKR